MLIEPKKSSPCFTPRSAIIGLLFSLLNIYWIVQVETLVYWNAAHPTTISLFSNAVFSLLLLVLFNLCLRYFAPNLQLGQGELLAVYAMVCSASAISGHGMMQIVVSLIGHAFWYASPENDWQALVFPYLPRWLTVADKQVLSGYYEGKSSLYQIEHIKVWAVPVLSWSSFIFALVFSMLCINLLLRKQWVNIEKLSYPIVQLPYRIITQPVELFKNKYLWIGLTIAGGIDLLNGLSYLYPVLPSLPIKIHHVSIFEEKPWSTLGGIPVSFYPLVIGLAFLIPLDLSFSCWFFFWFWRMERVLGSMMGWTQTGFPFLTEQATGGYIALCVIALWASRSYIKRIIQLAINEKIEAKVNTQEAISYRSAMLGLLIGLSFLLFFCYYAGMSIWVITTFFTIYLALEISITRMRAELGTPVHDLHYAGPDILLPKAIGTKALGPRNLSMFSMFWFLNRAHYSDVMPHQLEALKMVDMVKADKKGILSILILISLVAIPFFFWLFLDVCYQTGMEKRVYWFGWEAYNRLGAWLTHPLEMDPSATAFVGIGFLSTIGIAIMRSKFLWFVFHPAGYAISNSWGMDVCWLPIFISWAIKSLLLRRGGFKTYRRAIPLFMGLILGEFIIGLLWSSIGLIFGLDTYVFWVY